MHAVSTDANQVTAVWLDTAVANVRDLVPRLRLLLAEVTGLIAFSTSLGMEDQLLAQLPRTESFLLIDAVTGATVAGGVADEIRDAAKAPPTDGSCSSGRGRQPHPGGSRRES